MTHSRDADKGEPDQDYTFTSTPTFERSAKPAGVWVHCTGGDLPMPVEIRVTQSADGRWLVTGLMIGEEFDHQEVTSQTLRAIKLRELVATLLKDYDPDAPPDWTKFATILGHVVRANASAGWVANTMPRGPDEQVLRAFARTYLGELARRPHGAMTAAANAHNISRATANRWAQECRRLGYLPSVEHQQPDPLADNDERPQEGRTGGTTEDLQGGAG